MSNRKLWDLMQEVGSAVFPRYKPALDRFATETGLDVRAWGLLLAALTLEPETISVERLQVRGPYTAAEGYLARLKPALEKGYLAEVSAGEYRLTDTGRTEVEHSIEMVRAAMADADPLPGADGKRLLSLLRRLVGVSLATPPPPDTWSIRLSLKLMPALNPPLPFIEQAISCLAGYRDDTHLAAWRPSGLNGTALEALTLLWRGEADSLNAVCERLAHRGHARGVYAGALAELRQRELVEGPDAAPRVTKAGRRFRDEVEERTDRYFFGPWACLSSGDKAELANLLTRLRDGLRAGAL